MKKAKYIALCVISVICVLVLLGCAAQKDPQDKQNPEQSSGENTQPTGENAQNTDITWQTAVCSVSPFDSALNPKLQLLSYESSQNYVIRQLQEHDTCDAGKCSYSEGETTGDCDTVKKLKSITYPETFFNEKSLLLLQLPLGMGTPFEIKDVRYEEGVLTCSLEVFVPPQGTASVGAIRYWSVFISVDQVLPQETQVQLETENVTLEPKELAEKYDAFLKLHS